MNNWKQIDGYDNYSISTNGQIRNDKTGRILKPVEQRTGYMQVTLSKKGEKKTYLIHRLVMETFVPNPDKENLVDINHKDYNKTNNSVDNLEWTTHKQNIQWGMLPKEVNDIANEIKSAVVKILTSHLGNIEYNN